MRECNFRINRHLQLQTNLSGFQTRILTQGSGLLRELQRLELWDLKENDTISLNCASEVCVEFV